MNPFDASNPRTGRVLCIVCEKTTSSERWHARLAHGDWIVAVCCPLCAGLFSGNPDPYIGRMKTLLFLDQHTNEGL